MARANREDARARVRAAASARHLNGPSSSLICIRGDYTGIEQRYYHCALNIPITRIQLRDF